MNSPPYDTSGRKCPRHVSTWIKSNRLEHPDGTREYVRYCPMCHMEQLQKQKEQPQKAQPQVRIMKL